MIVHVIVPGKGNFFLEVSSVTRLRKTFGKMQHKILDQQSQAVMFVLHTAFCIA